MAKEKTQPVQLSAIPRTSPVITREVRDVGAEMRASEMQYRKDVQAAMEQNAKYWSERAAEMDAAKAKSIEDSKNIKSFDPRWSK